MSSGVINDSSKVKVQKMLRQYGPSSKRKKNEDNQLQINKYNDITSIDDENISIHEEPTQNSDFPEEPPERENGNAVDDTTNLTGLSYEATPKKKSRGRPRKNIQTPSTVTPSARSRRETKKVDYSALNDSKMFDDSLGDAEQLQPKPSTSKRGRKRKTEANVTNNSLLNDVKEELDKSDLLPITVTPSAISRRETIKVDYSAPNDSEMFDDSLEDAEQLQPKPSTSKRGRKRKSEANVTNNSLLNDVKEELDESDLLPISEDNKLEQSGYKLTGNLKKTRNHLFNVLQGKEGGRFNDTAVGQNMKRGRTKLSDLENEGNYICEVCKETVPVEDWPDHNSKKHYSLAWRAGDVPFPINDETIVLKTLTKLKKDRGSLICNKCQWKSKNSKAFYVHLDECNGVVSALGKVTCGVCHTELEKTNWSYHKYRQHNNLAWREGDPPLNLNDNELVVRILNALYKQKKPLHCELCNAQKKSVLGFLSHKSTCQKSEDEVHNAKVACDSCGKKILPVSMDIHLKHHCSAKASKQDDFDESDYFGVTVSSDTKRRAAKQALEVINKMKGESIEENKFYVSQCNFQEDFLENFFKKQLGDNSTIKCMFLQCDFSVDSIPNIVEHLLSCDKKPESYYICKICTALYVKENDMIEHLKKDHKKRIKTDIEYENGNNDGNDSEEDLLIDAKCQELTKLRQRMKQKSLKHVTTKVKPMFLVHPIRESNNSNTLYRQSYIWTEEFYTANYSTPNLYNNLRNKTPWKLLDCDLLMEYLPNTHESCEITGQILNPSESSASSDLSFKRLELFQAEELYEGDKTIYCGGPIVSLAWLPTPHDRTGHDQILAVSTLKDMDGRYSTDKNYNDPCLIQFWNFGESKCDEKLRPFLLCGLGLNVGPIWHMEWCPSGCLDCDDDGSRLGLLAVAASDSFVYIYSVDKVNDMDRGLIYKGNPVVKLQLTCSDVDIKKSFYPTKLSWSKAQGHSFIAVGYSTGLVALYNLSTESILLKKEDKGQTTIFPYHYFQAHVSTITVLSLNHLNGGNRWLCTASFDRMLHYWDLQRRIKISSIKKNNITDGVWMTMWPCCIVSEGETNIGRTALAHTYFKPLRDILTEPMNLTRASSGITCMSFSDWINTLLHGTATGEVMAQISQRFIFNLDKKFRLKYPKCVVTRTELIPRTDLRLELNLDTYTNSSRRFGLAFLDYELDTLDHCPNTKTMTKFQNQSFPATKFEQYQLEAINKIQFNPNAEAKFTYVTGHQAGFVRLRTIDFMKSAEDAFLKCTNIAA